MGALMPALLLLSRLTRVKYRGNRRGFGECLMKRILGILGAIRGKPVNGTNQVYPNFLRFLLEYMMYTVFLRADGTEANT